MFGYARCHGAIAISHVLDLLSGGQTTHAAQRTAKSTLTYELGTGEFPLLLFCFFIPRGNERRTKGSCSLSVTFSAPFHHPLCVFLNANLSFVLAFHHAIGFFFPLIMCTLLYFPIYHAYYYFYHFFPKKISQHF